MGDDLVGFLAGLSPARRVELAGALGASTEAPPPDLVAYLAGFRTDELLALLSAGEREAARLAIYRRVTQLADIDVLHTEIARHGVGLLDRGVPYLVRLARWRGVDRARRAARQVPIEGEMPLPSLLGRAADSTLDRLVASQTSIDVLQALLRLSQGELLAVWRHAEGIDDASTALEIAELEGTEPMSAAGVRQRRARALRKLRDQLDDENGRDP